MSKQWAGLLAVMVAIVTMLATHEYSTQLPELSQFEVKLIQVEAELIRVEAEAELFAVQVGADLAEAEAELASIEDAPYLYCLTELRTNTGNTAKNVAQWLKERGQNTKDWVTDLGSEK